MHPYRVIERALLKQGKQNENILYNYCSVYVAELEKDFSMKRNKLNKPGLTISTHNCLFQALGVAMVSLINLHIPH